MATHYLRLLATVAMLIIAFDTLSLITLMLCLILRYYFYSLCH